MKKLSESEIRMIVRRSLLKENTRYAKGSGGYEYMRKDGNIYIIKSPSGDASEANPVLVDRDTTAWAHIHTETGLGNEDPIPEEDKETLIQRLSSRSDRISEDENGGYVILGNVPHSLLIRNIVKSHLSGMDKDSKDWILGKFDLIPQGHGFVILVSSSGKATGIEFGSYKNAPCFQQGIDPIMRQFNLGDEDAMGDPDEFMLKTFLKNDENKEQFKAWLVNNPGFIPGGVLGGDERRGARATEEYVQGLSSEELQGKFKKQGVQFLRDQGMSRQEVRRLKKEKRFMKRTNTGFFAPGSVLEYDLGTVDVSSGLSKRSAERLVRKFQDKHGQVLGGYNSDADYGVFKARNLEAALSFAREKDCRPYVILPSGLSKRLRLSDNCGTLSYRIFQRAIGRSGALPLGLWNAPTTLLQKALEKGSDLLIHSGELR